MRCYTPSVFTAAFLTEPRLRRWRRTSSFVAIICLLVFGFPSADAGSVNVQSASSGYQYQFPRDHGAHENFRTEWWYYTGHLVADNGRRFGFELTFFRQKADDRWMSPHSSRWAVRHLYLAHAAVTEVDGGRFHYAEKVSRAGLGKAGADPDRLHVWIDRWHAEATTDGVAYRLSASSQNFSFDLTLHPTKRPIVHGVDGVSRKGEQPTQASHYYSLTRLMTRGSLTVGGQRVAVHGTSWMDHEFGSAELGPDQVGWDWFSIQLQDESELMFYRLRRTDRTTDPASSGTYVRRDATSQHLLATDVHIEELGSWSSPASGARYPSRWRITVPSLSLSLVITPRPANQELITTRSTQVTYWEGAVEVTGRRNGAPVDGEGYVELTGYAVPFRAGS